LNYTKKIIHRNYIGNQFISMKSVLKYFGITNGQMDNFFNENREKKEREMC
jgi:hypothetical protein